MIYELEHGLGVGGGRGRPKGSRNGYISPGAAYMKNYEIRGKRAMLDNNYLGPVNSFKQVQDNVMRQRRPLPRQSQPQSQRPVLNPVKKMAENDDQEISDRGLNIGDALMDIFGQTQIGKIFNSGSKLVNENREAIDEHLNYLGQAMSDLNPVDAIRSIVDGIRNGEPEENTNAQIWGKVISDISKELPMMIIQTQLERAFDILDKYLDKKKHNHYYNRKKNIAGTAEPIRKGARLEYNPDGTVTKQKSTMDVVGDILGGIISTNLSNPIRSAKNIYDRNQQKKWEENHMIDLSFPEEDYTENDLLRYTTPVDRRRLRAKINKTQITHSAMNTPVRMLK